MKTPLLALGLLLAASWGLQAQSHVDELNIEARATFHQFYQETDGVGYGSNFQGEYLNLNVKGHITPSLSVRLRQRLNKKIDDQNPFNATDFLWIKWQATPHWSFTFGKQPIMIGTYEVDSAPIDVYYYGAFTSHWMQYYAFGASLTWTPAPGQDISVQFIPSPISPVAQNAYSYNLFWNGHIGRHWSTTWSYNYVEDEFNRKMNYIALGNRFQLGPLALDVDFINRAAFAQPRFFLTDYSLIGKAIWTIGKFNICTKVGFEHNDTANVDPENGMPFDLTLPAGNDYFYGGLGFEYFPLGNDHVRIHVAYIRDNHDAVNKLDIGVTWRFWAIRRGEINPLIPLL